MAGWRVGFCVGNPEMVAALRRIKSYLDYGAFQPIQIASIIALNGPQDCVAQIRDTYQTRRDALISGFGEYGDEYVRFALIENPMRINQAVRGIRKIMP